MGFGILGRAREQLRRSAQASFHALRADLLLDLIGLSPPERPDRARWLAAAAQDVAQAPAEQLRPYPQGVQVLARWRAVRLAAAQGDAAALARSAAELSAWVAAEEIICDPENPSCASPAPADEEVICDPENPSCAGVSNVPTLEELDLGEDDDSDETLDEFRYRITKLQLPSLDYSF